MINIKKEIKKMEKHLRTKTDEKLIKGYKEAIKDHEVTGNEQCMMAAGLIKKELDRRGLDYE